MSALSEYIGTCTALGMVDEQCEVSNGGQCCGSCRCCCCEGSGFCCVFGMKIIASRFQLKLVLDSFGVEDCDADVGKTALKQTISVSFDCCAQLLSQCCWLNCCGCCCSSC